jgi:hypothetical protein
MRLSVGASNGDGATRRIVGGFDGLQLRLDCCRRHSRCRYGCFLTPDAARDEKSRRGTRYRRSILSDPAPRTKTKSKPPMIAMFL